MAKVNKNPLILVIEDEAPIRRFLKMSLLDHGFAFCEAATGKEGLSKVASERPDLVILDLGLPDTDGLEVTRQVREWSNVPIIVLSAREKENDKVEALDAGADDYLVKPFGIGELMARLRVALRHANRLSEDQLDSNFSFGDIHIDFAKRQILRNTEEIHLTPIEYKLLNTLVRYSGKVVTHKHLLRETWGGEYSDETQYLRVYMAQLRKKLELDPAQPKYLITEPGVGYRLKID
jgi:two-component system KDP operon response regulator KdpE